MVPDFLPVVFSRIDWQPFLAGCEKAIGRNVAASLDEKHIAPVGAAAFIPVEAEFKKPGTDALRAMRAGYGRHVYLGFLIVCDQETFRDLPLEMVSSTYTEGLGCVAVLASGSIQQWSLFMRASLSELMLKHTRVLAMKLMLWFERNDYGEVFGNYDRRSLSDGTYVLEQKRQ
jgi:hypothetical protein